MSTLPNPAPIITSTSQAFWDATTEGRFTLQKCDSCDLVVWVPRRTCPNCWQENLRTFDASGKGTVYSFTIIRKGAGDWKDAGPFVYAYVELDEGPRVQTNIVGCPVDDVHIGMKVEVEWHDTGKGAALYRFHPAR